MSMFSRYSAAATVAFISLAMAQTTTTTAPSTASASLWLPLDLTVDGTYAASVVNICSDTTTYLLSCSSDCTAYAPAFTIAAHSDAVEVNYQTSTLGFILSLTESCSIASSTSASCTATGSASANGRQTAIATSAIVSAATFSDFIYQIPITAGADKIGSSSGTCTAGAVHAAAPVLFGMASLGALVAAIML